MGDFDVGLERFVQAQAPAYAAVVGELGAGRKASHWMWFVFPQLKALGRSSKATFFGIENLEEAIAYWRHPLLGARLKHCTGLVMASRGKTLHEIFGSPDDLKFASCMTLFEAVAPTEPAFAQALDRFCAGVRDALTLDVLEAGGVRRPAA